MNEKELLVKYILGILTDEEKQQLDRWAEEPAHALYLEELKKRNNYSDLYREYKRSHPDLRIKRFRWKPLLWRAACCIIPIFVILGIYMGWHSAEKEILIKPGTSKAILFLDQATKVELGNSKEFAWIRINQMEIAAEQQGTLNYQHPFKQDIHQYNTLQTPRGGEYRVILEDGTRIHLNSLSTLSYPVCFEKDNRTVELSGEAYFEVAKDADRPFLVKVGDMLVRQYGTKFSITARSGKNPTVALEEGEIGITVPGKEECRLKSGDVAVWNKDNSELRITSLDNLEPYTAWHQARFVFDNESLYEIMQTLSLWYDMDIQFENEQLSKLRFTGSVGRYENINILLDAIEETSNVKFKKEGSKITIVNK